MLGAIVSASVRVAHHVRQLMLYSRQSMEKPLNEVWQEGPILAAVADGMGGGPGGQEAAEVVLTCLRTLTPAIALNTLRKVATARTGYTANKARKNLGAAWSWGVKYLGLPTLNPFQQVEKFPADQQPRYVPPETDFDKVMEAAGPQDKVFLLACLHTAARKGELFRLTWADIDFANKSVRLGTRKRAGGGMEYDLIPLTDDLCAALQKLRRTSSSFAVVFLPSQRGGSHCKERGKFMRLLCDKAGVKRFGLHAIRHLSASMMARANVSIPIIQDILRHKNPNTTARYLRALGSIPDVVNAVFSGKGKAPKVLSFEAPKEAIGT